MLMEGRLLLQFEIVTCESLDERRGTWAIFIFFESLALSPKAGVQ